MSITLGEALFKIHDHELNLPERWFTGQQWQDGTADKVIREDYRRAVQEAYPDLELREDDEQLRLL